MRALKLGEQVASIPGLVLVPGILDGIGEDGIQVGFAAGTNVLNTRNIVRSGHAVDWVCGKWEDTSSRDIVRWVFIAFRAFRAVSTAIFKRNNYKAQPNHINCCAH